MTVAHALRDASSRLADLASASSAALPRLPLNLAIYLSAGYDGDALDALRFDLLMITVGVVITAVICGAFLSGYVFPRVPSLARQQQKMRDRCSFIGNCCGACLVIFSFIFSSTTEPIWNRTPRFYAAVGTPPVVALLLSLGLTSLPCLGLSKPERCAVAVECPFQNMAIGFASALALFPADAAKASGVPLFYGGVQAVSIGIFLFSAWRNGWTYAPPTDPLCDVLRKSYQPTAGSGGQAAGSTSEIALRTAYSVTAPSASVPSAAGMSASGKA